MILWDTITTTRTFGVRVSGFVMNRKAFTLIELLVVVALNQALLKPEAGIRSETTISGAITTSLLPNKIRTFTFN